MALNMSQIIAADVLAADNNDQPLFSPTSENFYPYYSMATSPPSSDSPSPLRIPESEPMCIPTHQVFDLEVKQESPLPPLGTTVTTAEPAIAVATISAGSKRSASPAPPAIKKRAVGERVSSREFIPPDVTGLSKREARLVKNRAAAFLSRQRKREEFENMEVRVAELEQENKRLLGLAQQNVAVSVASSAQPDDKLMSEVEFLKAQLAAAQERERSLSAQLQLQQNSSSTPVIKIENPDTPTSLYSSPPPRSMALPVPHKSSASLGLMVLLCALPSLLSMRMQSTTAATNNGNNNPFAVSSRPNLFNAASACDFESNMFPPNDFDWTTSSASLMDFDALSSTSTTKKLAFSGLDESSDMGSLGDLDISFDAAPINDGKIRVRIHPPTSSSASSRSVSRGTTPDGEDTHMSSVSSASSTSSPCPRSIALEAATSSALISTSSDPFLGITTSNLDEADDMGDFMSGMKPFGPDGSLNLFAFGTDGFSSLSSPVSEYCGLESREGGKRRVRIALRSPPQAAGEGGEWEVQIC